MRVDFYAVCLFFFFFVRSFGQRFQTNCQAEFNQTWHAGPAQARMWSQAFWVGSAHYSPVGRVKGHFLYSLYKTPRHFKAELLENYKRQPDLFVIDINRGVFGEFNGVTRLPLAPRTGARGRIKVEKWHFLTEMASKVLKTKKQPHNMVTGIQNMILGEFNGVTRLPLAPRPGARGHVKVEKWHFFIKMAT